MTAIRNNKSSTLDPIQVGIQMWEAGSRLLPGNCHQSRDLWNSMAHSWGEGTGTWVGQFAHFTEAMAALRKPQEAAVAAVQAGVRLPLALIVCAPAGELRRALIQLIHAQNRAYHMWLEAFSLDNVGAASSESEKSAASEKPSSRSPRKKGLKGQTRKRKRNSPRL